MNIPNPAGMIIRDAKGEQVMTEFMLPFVRLKILVGATETVIGNTEAEVRIRKDLVTYYCMAEGKVIDVCVTGNQHFRCINTIEELDALFGLTPLN